MKFKLITESDIPVLQKWLSDEGLFCCTNQANQTADPSKPFESYLVYLDDDTPVGWMSLFNIEPSRAEFGIAIPDKQGSKITIKATVNFLRAAFQVYQFDYIYVTPTTEHSQEAARLVGFDENNQITLDQLERKWL